MNSNNKGSSWNKWDLHIHTPYTNLNNEYKCSIEDYCEAIKEKGLKVIGLTNYFIIHEKEFDEIVNRLKNSVFVIPNIEFRTNDKNWNNEYINIHVLFNPDQISIKEINNTLSRIELNNIRSENSIYCDIESIKSIGFDTITISIDKLIEQLKKDFSEKDYIVAGVPNGYGGFRPDDKPRSIELAKKYNGLSKMMFGRKEDTNFFLSRVNERANNGFLPKPNFVCSDAHSFEDIGAKTTWIKSDSSFEGLKQILFEPNYRVNCNDSTRHPYRIIESIKFNFPENTRLKNIHTNIEQPFCLSELKEEIFFSPYFTCIIGGRGSGKSTIINIIAEKLGEKTEFFKNNKITINQKTEVLKNYENTCVVINGTNEIEFISQGKIEELSSGNHLTDLIFNERIKAIGNEYDEKEKLLFSRFKIVEESINLIIDLEGLNNSLTTKKASLENDKKIAESFENHTYKHLSNQIAEITNEIEQITNNKTLYNDFLSDISNLLNSLKSKVSTDEYSSRVKEIIYEIGNIDEFTKNENEYLFTIKSFPNTDKILEDKKIELSSLQQNIVEYFKSIGISPDSILDLNRATSNFSILSNEIEVNENQIQLKSEKLMDLFSKIADIKELASECEMIIQNRLEKINGDLNIKNDNVERIHFEYQFNTNEFLSVLYKEFREQFSSYHKTNLSWDNINTCLTLIELNANFLKLTHEEYLEQISQKSFDKNSLYGRVFLEIIEIKSNFEIFKLLILRNFFNISQNIAIVGYYGESPLITCSFGQRCTAVVITLLMTGMKPLLIDEPEAHLDNRLIAEYLVELIKEKKNERQIIFATHNANFVLNGDAELIHILEIPKDKVFTKITSTTIENLSHRKSLLKLEGGEEAFKKRDKKLLSSVY